MLKSLCLTLALFTITSLSAQQSFPTPELITVDHTRVPLSDYVANGKPTVIAIWATWCQPCHLELDHMKDYLDKWTGEYGARVVAISVDKTYQMRKIKPLLSRKGWEYDVLVDPNGQLQAELGFRSIPQMYILDGQGKIVKEFSGYKSGRELEVDAVIRELASK